MARRRRDGSHITSGGPLHRPLEALIRSSLPTRVDRPLRLVAPSVVQSELMDFEDDRLWSPHERVPHGLRGPSLIERSPQGGIAPSDVPAAVAWSHRHFPKFASPRAVIVCARRSIRKEVMFATGQGGRKHRRGRRGRNSDVRC